MTDFDISKNTAIIEHDNHTLRLDTSLLEQIPFKLLSLYQCIGELHQETVFFKKKFFLIFTYFFVDQITLH